MSPQSDPAAARAPLWLRELARDIHHAIADDGLAPLPPPENNKLREVIERVLSAKHPVLAQQEVGAAQASVTDAMVQRFLSWPLPASVRADLVAAVGPPHSFQRTGTNLLTATEARAMLEHVLAGSPAIEGPDPDTLRRWQEQKRSGDGSTRTVGDLMEEIVDMGDDWLRLCKLFDVPYHMDPDELGQKIIELRTGIARVKVSEKRMRDLRMVAQHVEICGPDPTVRAAIDRLQAALAREPAPQAPTDAGEAKCDCDATPENRFPHHDECALNHPPAHAAGEWDELCRTLAAIRVIGVIDGHYVIRRSSVLEMAQRRADERAAPPPPAGDGDKHEADMLKLIDERDQRDEVIDDILDLVLGSDREEWTSAYGWPEALVDVQERMWSLESNRPADAQPATPADAGVESDWCPTCCKRPFVRTTPQPPALLREASPSEGERQLGARVEVDEAMVKRAEDYFYENSPFSGPKQLREGLRGCLTAALSPQAEQAGREVGRG